MDFSSEMIRRAHAKTEQVVPKPVFIVGDAAKPPLTARSFDAVLSRHVLWAMPDPGAALGNWIELLTPTGVLILIEGRWHTGAGLTADECLRLVSGGAGARSAPCAGRPVLLWCAHPRREVPDHQRGVTR